MDDKFFFNISVKNKVFTWTPPSTASRLSWKIFDNFEFSSYDAKTGALYNNSYFHNHFFGLPQNHKEYKLILTCRNPYTRARTGMDNTPREYLIRNLEDTFQSSNHFYFISLLKTRKPDYFIRVENLLEDYLKIPFIRESEFYKSGEMEKLIGDNPYKTKRFNNRPKIDKQIADLIYYSNVYYFELLGYDKNSWKE